MTPHWFKLLLHALLRGVQRRRRREQRPSLPFRVLGFEMLESRVAPAVNASFSGGVLGITATAADPIAIEIAGGLVTVNHVNPGTGPLAAGAVKQLQITGGPGANLIDLSQLVTGALPNFQSGSVSGGAGDTLIAPAQANAWFLTGANVANLDGTPHFNVLTHAFTGTTGGIRVQGVPNLTGGGTADTFNYESSSAVVTGTVGQTGAGTLTLAGTNIAIPGAIDAQGGGVTITGTAPLLSTSSVTFTGSVATQGGDLNVSADTIALDTHAGPVTLSTRDLGAVTGNPAFDPSVGNSGALNFTGISITLGSATGSKGNAGLFSQADGGFTAGAINLTAVQGGFGLNVPILPKVTTDTAGITLNAAVVNGGAVSFTATASSQHGDNGQLIANTPVLQTFIPFLQNFTLLAGIAVSTSNATINLGAASAIVAASFTAIASATASADVEPISVKLGVAVAVGTTNAAVTAAGAITTTGATVLQANAVDTLIAIASAGGDLKGAGAAVAVNVENSTSTAIVADTATLAAGGNLLVQANTVNNRTTQAVSATGDDGKIGIATAISSVNDSSVARVNGTATVGGDATIQATEVKNGVSGSKFFGLFPTNFSGVSAGAGAGTDDKGDLLNNLQGAATTGLLSKVESLVSSSSNSQQQTQAQAPAFQLAAAVAIDYENNAATASIGAGASVEDTGNLTVDANVNDRPNVLASSGIAQPSNPPKAGGNPATKFDGSVAVALGFYTNTARATITAGARADAGANLAVTSEALNDYQLSYGLNLYQAATQQPAHITNESGATSVAINPNDIVEVADNHTGGGAVGHWYQFTPTVGQSFNLTTTDFTDTGTWSDLGPSWQVKAKNVVQNFTTYLDGSFGLDNNLVDTWTQATANNPSAKIAATGSFTLLNLSQTSNAVIGNGAQINQNIDLTYRTGSQNVVVFATGTSSSTDLGGSVQVPGIGGSSQSLDISINKPGTGTQAGDAAVGAALVVVNYADNVQATIDSGVTLYADSLNVEAETAVAHISAMISGADSGKFGFNGVFSVVNVNDTTLAQIAAGSSITAGTGQVVQTFAKSTALVPALTTSAVQANAIAGTKGTDASGNTTNTINASLVVQAHDALDLFALDGGIMTAGNAGVGATVGVNLVKRDTEAFIGDPAGAANSGTPATIVSGGNVIVDSKDTGLVGTLSLAATKVSQQASTNPPNTSQQQQAPKQGGNYGIGISADVSFNQLTDTTLAYVRDTAVNATGLTITATEGTFLVAASGAAALVTKPQGSSVGIAGAYAQNSLGGGTRAFVDNSTLTTTGDVTISATTTGQVDAVTASGSVARNNQGIAIAGQVSVNTIGATTKAEVVNQTAVTAQNVSVTAHDTEGIFAVGGALAYGGRAGFGASVSLNTIPLSGSDSVWADFQDSDVAAGGTLTVAAQAQESVKTITAAIGASKTGMAAAAAISINTITPDTQAFIRRKRTVPLVTVDGVLANDGVTVSTSDTPTIQAIAGGAGMTGGALGVGAAFALNDIGVNIAGFGSGVSAGTIEAEIEGTTIMATTGPVSVTAVSGPSIQVIAAALGAAVPSSQLGQQNSNTKLGLGFGVALNDIMQNVSALIDSTAVTTHTGGVTVSASSTAQISVLALGGGGALADSQNSGLAIAGAGAGAGDVIRDTLTAAIQNGSTVTTTAGGVTVTARDTSTITADAGGFSIAVAKGMQSGTALSIGASVAANAITNSVAALIAGGSVSAGGAVTVTATSTPTIDALTLAGSFAGAQAQQGATAVAGAGAGSLNTIQDTVAAAIGSALAPTRVTTTTGNAVTVAASDTSAILANAGGLAVALASGQSSGTGFAIGAAAAFNTLTNQVTATIDNATVASGSGVSVTATGNEKIFTLTVGIAGTLGSGKQDGLALAGAGSFSLNSVANTIAATIQNSTTAGPSPAIAATNGGTVAVQATDSSNISAAAGAVALGVALGQTGGTGLAVGVSVSVNHVANTIDAGIAGSSVAGDGGVAVRATSTENLAVLTVAGALAGSSGQSSALAFAGAGAAADNSIANTIEATIANSAVTSANGAVLLDADDHATITAAAGAVALSIALGQSSSVAGAFGASLALNTVGDTVETLVSHATLAAAGTPHSTGVSMTAVGEATILATTVAAAGGVAGGQSGGLAISGAGAGSSNAINNTIEAIVSSGSHVTAGGSVSLSATDRATIQAVAVGVTISGASGGAAGVGAAAAGNTIGDTTLAQVDGSTVSAGGDFADLAQSMATILVVTVGLSGALAGGQEGGIAVAGAGSGSGNTIRNKTRALITGGSSVTSGGSATVEATDSAAITAAAGAGSIAAAGGQGGGVAASLGFSLAVNDIANQTIAQIDDAALASGGFVHVEAATTATILVVTAAGGVAAAGGEGGGLAFSGDGAVSINTIASTTQAEISDGGPVSSANGQAVQLLAHDDSDVKAIAGAVTIAGAGGEGGGAAGALGAAGAVNTIRNTVLATINQAGVHSAAGVDLEASSAAHVFAVTVGFSGAASGGEGGGIALSGAGSFSANTIANTVEASIRGPATVTTAGGGAVTLSATDTSTITAAAGAGSFAGAGGQAGGLAATLSGSVAANKITNTVQALIDNGAIVTSDAGVSLTATSNANILAVTGAGAVAGAGGQGGGIALAAVGTGSVNTIGTTTQAVISRGSIVTTGNGADVTLSAADTSTIFANADAVAAAGAGGQGGGGAAAAGAAFAVNSIGNTVKASIDGSTVRSAGAVTLTARSAATIHAFTFGLSGGGSGGQGGGITLTAAGSGSDNAVNNVVEASITSGSTVTSGNAGNITLSATDTSSIVAAAGAGSFAGAGGQGGGIAATLSGSIAVNQVGNTVRAVIDHSGVTSAGGVSLTATSSATITAITEVGALAGAGGQGGGIAVTLVGAGSINSIADATIATIADSSNVTANGAGVTLNAIDNAGITANAGALALAGAGGQGGGVGVAAGAAFALNSIGNTVKVTVDASAVTTNFGVSATASTGETINVVTTGFSGAITGGQGGGISAAGAGSFSVNSVNNTTVAGVLDQGTVTANGAVALSATDHSTITAGAGSGALAGAGGQGGGIGAALGFSIAFNTIGNTTKALVDASTLTKSSSLSLTARATAGITAVTVAGAVAAAGGQGGGIAVAGAGAGSKNTIADTVEAGITGGSQVNAGAVTLNATDTSSIAADAGVFSGAGAIGQGGGVAATVGASVALNAITNTVEALIVGSTVNAAGAVDVEASSGATILVDTIAFSGAISGNIDGGSLSLAGAGAGSGNTVANTVEAAILADRSGAHPLASTVTAGGAITLKATDSSTINAYAGAQALGVSVGGGVSGAVGAGIAVAANDVGNQVLALVDGSTVSGPGLEVDATSTAAIDALTIGVSDTIAGGTVGIAFGGAGSGSKNKIHNTTKAAIIGGSSVTTTGLVMLHGHDDSHITAAAGSGALNIAIGAAAAVGGSFAASVAVNDITNAVLAVIDGSTVAAGGAVDLMADSTAHLLAVTVAGTGSVSGGVGGGLSVTGAGAGSSNTIHNQVEALVQNGSTVGTALQPIAGLALTATDSSTIEADAGGASLGLSFGAVSGSVSVGAAAATNTIGNTIRATIDSSAVHSSAGVEAQATSAATIDTITVGVAGGLAAGGVAVSLAGAGAGSDNQVADTIEAAVKDGSVVTTTAGSGVALDASDLATITARAGALGISGAGGALGVAGAVGLAIADNDIGSTATALIDGSTVHSAGALTLDAVSTAHIDVVTATGSAAVGAGAFGAAAAGAGTDATNNIHDTISALVSNSNHDTGHEVTAGGAVQLTADDHATIDDVGVAGAVSVAAGSISGAASVGVALATNTIADVVHAGTDDASVEALAGDLSATAQSAAQIHATAVAAALGVAASPLGVAFSGGGAQATNTTTSSILAYFQDGSSIHADQGKATASAKDTSTDNASITAASVAAGLIGVAVGVAQTTDTVNNTVSGYVDGSTVVAATGIDVKADATQTVTANTVATAASISFGAAGAAAQSSATIGGTVQAYLQSARLTATGQAVNVQATSTLTVNANASGGAGGLASLAVMQPTATLNGATLAYAAGTTAVNAGTLNIHATSGNSTDAETTVVGVGALTGIGADPTATTNRATKASIAAGSTVTATGAIDVNATATAGAKANAVGVAGGAIAVSAFAVTATVNGSTWADIGEGATVSAGSLAVAASATNTINTRPDVLGIGLYTGSGLAVTTTISPDVEAFVGPQGGGAGSGALTTITAGTVTLGATATNNGTTDSQNTGVGVVNVAVLTLTTTIGGSTSAYVAGHDQVNTGSFVVTATGGSNATGTGTLNNISAGSGTDTDITATVTHSVAAYVAGGATVMVTATGGSGGAFSLKATGTPTATASTNGLSISAITVGFVHTTATQSGGTQAYLGGGATVTAGAVSVEADTNATANAASDGGSGGLVDVSELKTNATEQGNTQAYVGERANVTALSLTVTANGTRNANSNASIVNVGIGGSGVGADTNAKIAGPSAGSEIGVVEAFVGPDALSGAAPSGQPTTLTVTGAVIVQALSASNAGNSTSVGAGGFISGVGQQSQTDVDGSTLGYLGNGTALHQGAIVTAGSLTVSADAADVGAGSSTVAGGGAINATHQSTNVNVQPHISAYLGQFGLGNVAGDVKVAATSERAEGHATANDYGGGGVQVGIADANTTASPTVKGYIDAGTSLTAGGSVTVTGSALSTPSQQQSLTLIQLVNTGTDTITVNETLHNGDLAVYDYGTSSAPIQTDALNGQGNVVPTKLQDDRMFQVIALGSNQYQLGSLFDGAGVDPALNVIHFATPHTFQTGDEVRYVVPAGSTPIGGLSNNGTYFVRVISPTAIKLYPSAQGASAPADIFDPNAGITIDHDKNGNPTDAHFNANSQNNGNANPAGFVNGEAVSYQAPPPVVFNGSNVNSNLPRGQTTDIYLGAINPYHNGDKVVYSPQAGTPIGSLGAGTYFVVGATATTIQLATTSGGAALALTAGSGTGQLQQPAIGGLAVGHTYYVANLGGHGSSTFQLSTTADGKHPILLDPSTTSGNHQLVPDGVPLAPGSGPQNLHIQLSGSSTRGDVLLPAQAGAAFVPPVGTGQSTSSADGGTGGVIDVSQPSATTSFNPSARAYVNAGNITAGGNVTIASESIGNTNAHADNAGGGLGYFGSSSETTNFGSSSQASVGAGTQITAVGEFSLTSDTQLNSGASGHSDGGGFIATAENDATVNAGDAAHPILTTSTINSGARVYAGSVNLLATASKFNVSTSASATAGGLGGSATADSESKLYSNATVNIAGSPTDGGTIVDGASGVDVRALNEHLTPDLNSDAHFYGLFGGDSSPQHSDFGVGAHVTAGSGATVRAGPRPAGTPLTPVSSFAGFPYLALYVQGDDAGISYANSNSTSEDRTIVWDANVKITCGPDPYLFIAPGGQVTADDNVVVHDGSLAGPVVPLGGTVSSGTAAIEDIHDAHIGQALFEGGGDSAGDLQTVANSPHHPPYPAGEPYPLFTFDYAFQKVTLINQSANTLQVHNIDVVDRADLTAATGSGEVDVELQSPKVADLPATNIPLNFRIAHTIEPSVVDIENQDTAVAASDIVLDGTITNPIGTTIVNNVRGNIDSAGASALIYSNIFALTASGSIGTAADRLYVELIESADPTGALRPIVFTATATAGNVYLDMTARRRDGVSGTFVVPIESITAGGDVNLVLEAGVVDPAATGSAGPVKVGVNSSSKPFFNFFYPDDSGTLGLDRGVFTDMTQASAVTTTYDFQPSTGQVDGSGAASGAAGLTAGGNIIVNAAHAAAGDPTLNVVGTLNLKGTADYLETTTNGSINYGEGSQGGTLRVHVVQSTAAGVMLTVPFIAGMSGQDLELIAVGALDGLISALTTVLLQVGDNLTTDGDAVPTKPAKTLITAGTSITIDGDYANAGSNPGSTLTINGALSSPLTNVNAGGVNDTVNLNTSHDINTQATSVVSNFTGAVVNVDGQAGVNHLKVSDATYQGQDAGVLTDHTLTGLGMGGNGLTYTNIQHLEVDLSQGNVSSGDTFTGRSYFAVLSTHAGCPTLVEGGAGDDTVVVASDANVPGDGPLFTSGTLAGILGELTVDGAGGSANRLVVSNYAAPASQTVQVTFNTVTSFAPVPLHYQATGGHFTDAGAHDGIRLVGANVGGNTFNVQGTLGGSSTHIDGDGGANDFFNVYSNAAGSGAGSPDAIGNDLGIAGDLEVVGGSGTANRLIASDLGHASPDTDVTVTNAEITGLAPANLYYSALGNFTDPAGPRTFDGILLLGPSVGGNTFNVQSTLGGSTTEILGEGGNADFFNVYSDAAGSGPGTSTAGSNVLGIQGKLTVVGGTSLANRLIVSDRGDDGSHASNRNLSQIVVTDHSILNLAPAFIYYSADPPAVLGNFTNTAAGNGIWIQGSGTAPNTFLVYSTLTGSTTQLDGGAANDGFNFAAELASDVANPDLTDPTLPAIFFQDQGNLNLLRGLATVNGNGGADSIETNDHGQLYTVAGVQQYAVDDNGNPILPLQPLHVSDDGPVPATSAPAKKLATDPHYQYAAADPAYGYNYLVTPTTVLNDPATVATIPAPTTPPARTFAGIAYNTIGDAKLDTVTFVRLDGTDRTNRFTVQPDIKNVTTFLIDGNMPNSACRKDGGNYLDLNTTHMGAPGSDAVFSRKLHIFTTPNTFAGTTDGTSYYPDLPAAGAGDFTGLTVPAPTPGRPLATYIPTTPGVDSGELSSSTGNGYWDFKRNGKTFAKPVYFLSIERFNHVAITAEVSVPPPNSNQVPYVIVRDAETGDLKFTVQPYESFFHGGINVAVGDLNCDGIPDLVTIPEAGHDAEVKIYDGSPDAFGNYPHKQLNDFLAFNKNFLGGGSVAIGDTNYDGHNDLVVGAGQGYVPVIEVYDGHHVLQPTPPLLGNAFYAFSGAFGEVIDQNFKGGVNVAAGDLNNDGYAEIVATPASNGPPLVNVFSGKNDALLRGFYAFNSANVPGGLAVAIGDVTGDHVRDIVVGSAPGFVPEVAVFSGATVFTSPVVQAVKIVAVAPLNFRGAISVQTAPTDGGSPGTVELDAIFAQIVADQAHSDVANELFETITSFDAGGGTGGTGGTGGSGRH